MRYTIEYMNVVFASSDILGGTPVFIGTRVPVQTLMDYIESGDSIDRFLEDFPTVTKEQVIEFLEAAKNCSLSQVKVTS